MKTIVTLLILFTLFSLNTFAQEYTQWGIPEGAKARLGKGSISEIAYSPDGTQLAVASSIGIWLYDVQAGEELALLTGHTGSVNSMVFSPDGTILASISTTGVDAVHLWDVATGMLKNTLKGHASVVTSIAFSPDGTTLAGGGDIILTVLLSEDNALFTALLENEDLVVDVVWLWDIATGNLKNTLKGRLSIIRSITVSPDGTTLAGVNDDGTVSLWDIVSGTIKATLEGHTDGFRSVAFSPDGTTLAGVLYDGGVGLWDAATGTLKNTLKGDTDLVLHLVFSPDGTTLASGSWDDTVHLWDVTTGTLKNTLKGGIIFSPDGTTFVGVNENDTLQVGGMAFLQEHTGVVKSVAFSPDGATLASGYKNGDILLWDVAAGTLKNTLKGHTDEVNIVVFSPDGATLASVSASSSGIDTVVGLWDVATGTLKNTLEGHTSTVWSIVFSPDGMTLASGSWDGTVRLWDVATGTLKNILEHTRGVRHAVFSPDGMTLASGSDDGGVHLWDVATGTLKNTLKGHEDVLIVPDVFSMNSVWRVDFSPDETTLASGYENGDVLLWDVATGTRKATLERHTNVVNSVAFSPDGTTLASGSWDDTVHLWDAASGTHKAVLEGDMLNINHVVFSPDSMMLTSGSSSMGDNALLLRQGDTVVHLWDVASGTLEDTRKGHTNVVSSIAFSPDGTTLASGSWDGTVLLWELPSTREPVVQPQLIADVNGDGSVNILDLVVIAASLGQAGQNKADVNGDGVVSILDLVLAAGMFADVAAAPSLHPETPETLTAVEVQGWLTDARALEVRNPIMRRGIVVLEQLLVFLTPTETQLLVNYPNPFNPETWIPYQLAEDAFVTLTIYDQTGHVVRTIDIGHRIAAVYENQSKAIYWDGRNELGEQVASGIYFYQLSAGDYSATRKMVILK